MAACTPFLLVPDIYKTIQWYKNIGFTCTATNETWEPGCELNWAMLKWQESAFMIGIDERENINQIKDCSIWFDVDAVDDIIEMLKNKSIEINIEPATFYGRKVVSFKDINGFGVSFSCALKNNT